MSKRINLPGICLAVGIIFFHSGSTAANAHSFGNIGYSDISIEERTIDYVLLLDHDQLLSFLPIDVSGDGKIDHKEFSQTALIRQFITDFITVSANGVKGEPSVVKASEDKRSNQPLVRFELRYVFDRVIQSYEMDYRLFFNDIDPDHKNFAAIRTSESNNDIIISREDHVLKGNIETRTSEQKNHPKSEKRIVVASLAAFLSVASAFMILMRRLTKNERVNGRK